MLIGKNFKFIVSKPYRTSIEKQEQAKAKQEQAKAKVANETIVYKISNERLGVTRKEFELLKEAIDHNWIQFERRIQFLDNQIKNTKDKKTKKFLTSKKNEAIGMINNNKMIPIEMIDSERIYFREEI